MAHGNKHKFTFHLDFEYLFIFLYILFTAILIYTDQYNFYWFYFLTGSLIFWLVVIKLLSKLFYRVFSFQSFILDTLQEVILRILFKIGLGKYVAQMIQIVNEEKEKEDNDANFKPYLQYFERKKMFQRILNPRLHTGLLVDMGGDGLYLAKHFIHKKRVEVENAKSTKHFTTLSNADFKDLIKQLFQAMGYTVQSTGKPDDHMMDLIIQLENQKLFIRGIKHIQQLTISEIDTVIKAQQSNNCHASLIISLPYVSQEVQYLAHKYSIGIITQPRLKELLLQYLKEKWD